MSTIAIIGAGIVGTATALRLAEADPGLDVVVIEADPTYARAATGRGTGGIRQLFSSPENILLSQHTLDIVDDWDSWAAVGGEPAPELSWQANGYLFIARPSEVDQLRRNYEVQVAHGVRAEWLTPDELSARHPEIRTDDLAGAVLSPRDGWLDPKAFFTGVRRRARAAGVREIHASVTEIVTSGNVVRGVRLDSGELLAADVVINCAGTWAPELARQLGIEIPVEPMRRHEHFITADRPADNLPFIKDVDGLAIHAHHGGFAVGLVDFDHPGGEDFTIDPTYCDRVVLPAMSHRLSGRQALTGLTERRTWTGLYDQNRLDGNAIIGNRPGHFDNFWFACGFSGHGFMHALGVGRALAEQILTGAYATIDLTRLEYARVERNAAYPELGVR